MRVSGKVALVTGSAQGLGEAICRTLAREGASVYVCDLNDEVGSAVAASIRESGADARYIHLDVTDESSWVKAFDEVRRHSGRIDVLVNNAGINIRETIETMTPEHLDTMLAVNVKGPFIGIKHAIPLMRAGGGGSIINMSSICGLIGHKYTTEAYTVTKGALTLMTKSVGVRYREGQHQVQFDPPEHGRDALVKPSSPIP